MPKPPRIRLEDSRIRSLNFSVREEDLSPGQDEVVLGYKLGYGYDYNYRKRRIILTMHLTIDDDKTLFVLDMEYQGLFRIDKCVSHKKIEPFAKINCPAILFPFLRECVAELTRRAGLNPLLLPSVNFVERARTQDTGQEQT